MAVVPEQRKLGLGSRLLNYFEVEARKRGAQAVTLEVDKTNTAAISLYERVGYTKKHILQDYYGPGQDGILMDKPLQKGKRRCTPAR